MFAYKSDKYKVVYFPIPKCACTSIKKLLLKEKDIDVKNVSDYNVHVLAGENLERFSYQSALSSQLQSLVVLRDPYARVVSAFLDKVIKLQATQMTESKFFTESLPIRLAEKSGKPFLDTDFTDFVRFLEPNGTGKYIQSNEHWRQYTKLLDTNNRVYDRVIDISQVGEIFPDIGKSNVVGVVGLKEQSTTESAVENQDWTHKKVSELIALYNNPQKPRLEKQFFLTDETRAAIDLLYKDDVLYYAEKVVAIRRPRIAIMAAGPQKRGRIRHLEKFGGKVLISIVIDACITHGDVVVVVRKTNQQLIDYLQTNHTNVQVKCAPSESMLDSFRCAFAGESRDVLIVAGDLRKLRSVEVEAFVKTKCRSALYSLSQPWGAHMRAKTGRIRRGDVGMGIMRIAYEHQAEFMSPKIQEAAIDYYKEFATRPFDGNLGNYYWTWMAYAFFYEQCANENAIYGSNASSEETTEKGLVHMQEEVFADND